MKNIEFLILARDIHYGLNCRAYSDEQHLREYMEIFQDFGGVQIDKKVDNIILEAKNKGKSQFRQINGSKIEYCLVYKDYIYGYMNYGSGNSAKMTLVR